MCSSDLWAAVITARLHYQYAFGLAAWLIWLGLMIANGSIYVPDGWLFGIDYVAFYSAGKLVLEGQSAELYNQAAVREVQRQLFGLSEGLMMTFMNPPFYALFMVPFAALPFVPSLLVWTVFSLGIFCLGLLGLEGKLRLQTLAVALCFFPVFYTVRNGQNSLFTAGLFGIVYGLLRKERPFAAGLVASLLLYKPHMILGVALLWLVQARRWWPALAGLACGSALVLGVSELAMPGTLAGYKQMSVEMLANWIYQPQYKPWMQFTIQGLVLTLWPGQRPLAEAAQYLTLALGILSLWLFCRRQSALPLTYAAAVLILVCTSMHLLLYDWTILVVPAVLLWRYAPAERDCCTVTFAAVWLIAYLALPILVAQYDGLGFGLHIPFLVLVAATYFALMRAATTQVETDPAPAAAMEIA